jgi:hypothetical protein
MDDPLKYLRSENIDDLIDLSSAKGKMERGVYNAVRVDEGEPLPPELDDLARLHRLIRDLKSFTVLEFGIGYSTVVIADALQKNEKEWEALDNPPEVRNRFMFEVFCVDASEGWIDHWRETIPDEFTDRIHIKYSPVEIDEYNHRICHTYTDLPDIVPDFVYLDAPHPKQVSGEIYGLSFDCDERTVISADLLHMEPTLLPGTVILVDGRTNNARFLKRNFQRSFEVKEDKEADVTIFKLTEDRLGKYNILGKEYIS